MKDVLSPRDAAAAAAEARNRPAEVDPSAERRRRDELIGRIQALWRQRRGEDAPLGLGMKGTKELTALYHDLKGS